MDGYKINSIETLCSFIMVEKPDLNQVNQLLWLLGMRVIILDEAEPAQYCKQVKDYWQKWQLTKERPLFIGVTLDLYH